MTDSTTVATEELREPPRWRTFAQDWKAVAWPATAAVLAALLLYLGYVADGGRRTALGVSSLEREPFGQQYLILGGIVLATLGLQIAIILMFGVALRALALRTFKHLPRTIQDCFVGSSRLLEKTRIIIFLTAIAIPGLGLWYSLDLRRRADAMVLKSAKDIGSAWLSISLDQSPAPETLQLFFIASILTVFVALSWWVFTDVLSSPIVKYTFSIWFLIQVLNLTSAFAFILGVAYTFEPFPVVAFSSQEQFLGKGALPILLDSDDKLYAFLVIFTVEPDKPLPNPNKMILYLPRSEVKWMTVLRKEPLQLLARYPDAKAAQLAHPDGTKDK